MAIPPDIVVPAPSTLEGDEVSLAILLPEPRLHGNIEAADIRPPFSLPRAMGVGGGGVRWISSSKMVLPKRRVLYTKKKILYYKRVFVWLGKVAHSNHKASPTDLAFLPFPHLLHNKVGRNYARDRRKSYNEQRAIHVFFLFSNNGMVVVLHLHRRHPGCSFLPPSETRGHLRRGVHRHVMITTKYRYRLRFLAWLTSQPAWTAYTPAPNTSFGMKGGERALSLAYLCTTTTRPWLEGDRIEA